MTEPTTTLTDYAIAVFTLIFAGSLLRVGWINQQTGVLLWAAAFGFVSVAAALGGTCHGFMLGLGEPLTQTLWELMIYTLTLASFSMLAGTIISSVPAKFQRWCLLGAVTKSTFAWTVLVHLPRFGVAAFDYAFAMAIVFVLQLKVLADSPSRAPGWILSGILISGVAIGILDSDFTIFALNHNDLYHLVQLVGLGLIYQGARQLKDWG
jgi:hypothetical protein